MSVTLYGFRGCDTVRNAMKWLDAHAVPYHFVDYRREALAPGVVDDWFARAGWETVFNRNATTFKDLPEAEKRDIDAARAKAMLLAETNFIKRPVLDTGDALFVGFKANAWAGYFSSRT